MELKYYKTWFVDFYFDLLIAPNGIEIEIICSEVAYIIVSFNRT